MSKPPPALKPCPMPNCGGRGHMHYGDGEYWVQCASPACNYAPPTVTPQEEVAAAEWNRRPHAPTAPGASPAGGVHAAPAPTPLPTAPCLLPTSLHPGIAQRSRA